MLPCPCFCVHQAKDTFFIMMIILCLNFIFLNWRIIALQNFVGFCQMKIFLALRFVLSQQDNVDLGELMFSLCYLPTAGRLTITIIKARNLKAMDITGASGGTISNSHFFLQFLYSTSWSFQWSNKGTWTLEPNCLGLNLVLDLIAVWLWQVSPSWFQIPHL